MKNKNVFLMIIALFVIIGFVTEQAYGQQPSPRAGQIDPATGKCMRCGSDPCRCFGNSTVRPISESEAQQIMNNPNETQQIIDSRNQAAQPQVPPAESFTVEQLADNTLAITRAGGGPNIIIPDTLYGLKVTIIKNFSGVNPSFSGGRTWGNDYRSIVFPNTVTEIRGLSSEGTMRQSEYRSSTSSVTFGNSLKIIGNYTFFSHNNLTAITLPNSVVEIGIQAFAYCGLTSINLPSGIKRIYAYAFDNNKITSVTIPSGIEAIGESAFGNNNIQSVSIPAGVKTVIVDSDDALWNLNASVFYGNPITRATLPANLSNAVMRRWGFETNLINFYANQNRAAGTYVKNGPIWSKQ